MLMLELYWFRGGVRESVILIVGPFESVSQRARWSLLVEKQMIALNIRLDLEGARQIKFDFEQLPEGASVPGYTARKMMPEDVARMAEERYAALVTERSV